MAIQQDLTTSLYQPYAVRSEEYLQQYGKCFDHIKPGRSTMVQAGRGAFAMRPLAKDTIISGSPLLHLPYAKVMRMHPFSVNASTGEKQRLEDDDDKRNTTNSNTTTTRQQQQQQQLVVNYCFGHAQSTLLLCPYGAGVNYINHNQTLANVRVQWSQHGLTSHNDSWFNMTPSQMEWLYKPQLALDYIALRDIEEGEELFLDYGNEFEAAWQHHVATWKPVEHAASYASAHDFNIRMADTPLRTEQEQEMDPYPDHLQIRCHSILITDPYQWKYSIPDINSAEDFWSLDDKGYPCRIVQRLYENGSVNQYYNVVIVVDESSTTKDDGSTTVATPEVSRNRVPRHAISFSDKPYTTDMHLPNAFRFPMMIPDDIFPDAWRNANVSRSNETTHQTIA
jgi:hypothetical protein